MFSQVVALCVTDGLVQTGAVAIDGTKIEVDVSAGSSATRRQIVDEILEEAEADDAAEDLEYGARRGDELPIGGRIGVIVGPGCVKRYVNSTLTVRPMPSRIRQIARPKRQSWAASSVAVEQIRQRSARVRLGPAESTSPTRIAARSKSVAVSSGDTTHKQPSLGTRLSSLPKSRPSPGTRSSSKQWLFAAEENLVDTGADRVETFVADTGYWSISNATLDSDADVLITPMPLTGGITDPDDPRLAQRREVIERLDGGDVTVTAAAAEMEVSTTTARKLLRIHRAGRG